MKINLLSLFIVLFSASSFAGELNKVITFEPSDISLQKIQGYDMVRINGCDVTHIAGTPMLPQKIVSVVLPVGAVVTSFKAISLQQEFVSGEYNIFPAQSPITISSPVTPKWIPPDPAVYNTNVSYPSDLILHSHIGNMGGYRIASFLVYPFQYNPVKKSLLLHSKIEIQITYKGGILPVVSKTTYQKNLFYNILKNKVINPEHLNSFSPSSKSLLSDTIEYVIITVDSFVSSFQPLADWKTKKGVPTTIVTLDSIYSNFSGRDNPEKIRNFIKYANTNWGTIWVLLGGQCDFENNQSIVPRRDVYYWTSGNYDYVDEDTIPCDLYFSDLDGTWNNDGDALWGEKPVNGDTVDFYSDVFVGRASLRTKTQVQTFVNKVLTYEKSPPSGYLKRMFLPSGRASTLHDGTRTPEAISIMTPSGWQDIKLYEISGTLTRTRMVDTLNSGIGFAHIFGHGNVSGFVLYSGSTFLSSSNIDTLKNSNKRGIINSSACFTGAFDKNSFSDKDCLAEHLLYASGGAVATMMNSRYGWGDQYLLYWSEALDTSFYDEVFYRNKWHLGEAFAISKDNFVPAILWNVGYEHLWAWVIYELNLLGDPEMPMWTDEPGTLTATHNDTLGVGHTSFQVNVSSGAPVESALVCAMKAGEIYARGYTNSSGQVTLTLTPPATTTGTMYVTATKHNYKPYEGTVVVADIGIEEITSNKNYFEIIQNPTQNEIIFKYSLSNTNPNNIPVITIYEPSGRIVKILTCNTKSNELQMDSKELHNGIYFVKLAAGNFKGTKKLVLVK